MITLFGPQLYTLLLFSIGAFIRLYPLRSTLKLKPKLVAGIYALFFIIQSAVFIALREYFAVSYNGNQMFVLFCGFITMLIPVFITRAGIFQHIFGVYVAVFCTPTPI